MIDEINFDSPHKYNGGMETESKMTASKKKKKKLSHDHGNRVIKFSTGEPYLEYLPHMLSSKDKQVHFLRLRARSRKD